MEIVKDLDKSFLEAGAVDLASSFFRSWRSNDGVLTDTIVSLSPYLVINNWDVPDESPPDIMFAGNESLAVKMHGRNFFDPTRGNKQIPDQQLKKVARNGYARAHSGEPVYDFVCTRFGNWERLILPFSTKTGFKSLFTLCIPSGPFQIIGQSYQAHHSDDCTPTNYQARIASGSISI